MSWNDKLGAVIPSESEGLLFVDDIKQVPRTIEHCPRNDKLGAVIPSTARDLLFVLAQSHAGEIEQQFRLSIAAKHQPCDQHGDDQSERMPNNPT